MKSYQKKIKSKLNVPEPPAPPSDRILREGQEPPKPKKKPQVTIEDLKYLLSINYRGYDYIIEDFSIQRIINTIKGDFEIDPNVGLTFEYFNRIIDTLNETLPEPLELPQQSFKSLEVFLTNWANKYTQHCEDLYQDWLIKEEKYIKGLNNRDLFQFSLAQIYDSDESYTRKKRFSKETATNELNKRLEAFGFFTSNIDITSIPTIQSVEWFENTTVLIVVFNNKYAVSIRRDNISQLAHASQEELLNYIITDYSVKWPNLDFVMSSKQLYHFKNE